MRAVPLVLLGLLLAGCFGGDPPEEARDPEVRGDRAVATYATDDPDVSIDLFGEPRTLWTPRGTQDSSVLVTVRIVSANGAVIDPRDPATAFDRCGRFQWGWHEPGPSDDMPPGPRFATWGNWAPGLLAPWALRRADLPETGESVVQQGFLDLHARRVGEGWEVSWVERGRPADWESNTTVTWRTDAPFPDGFSLPGGQSFHLSSYLNAGEPLTCANEPSPPRRAWGPWGPDEDLPLTHSYKAMVQQVLDDQTLVTFQSFRRDHPDAYITSAIGWHIDGGNGLTDVAGLAQDYHWQVSVGYPGAGSGIGFTCEVREGGAELADLFFCSDGMTWSASPDAPAPDFSQTGVPPLEPMFAMQRRYAGLANPGVSFNWMMTYDTVSPWLWLRVGDFPGDNGPSAVAELMHGGLIGFDGVSLEAFVDPPA